MSSTTHTTASATWRIGARSYAGVSVPVLGHHRDRGIKANTFTAIRPTRRGAPPL